MRNLLKFLKNSYTNLFLSGGRKPSKQALSVLQKVQSIAGEFKQERVLNILREVDFKVFRELIAIAYQRQNYRLGSRPRNKDKNRYDTFYKDGNTFLICCNQNRETIELVDVADFNSLVRERGVIGVFIHTARTSQYVLNMLQNTRIAIVSGEDLVTMMGPYKSVNMISTREKPQLMYGS